MDGDCEQARRLIARAFEAKLAALGVEPVEMSSSETRDGRVEVRLVFERPKEEDRRG